MEDKRKTKITKEKKRALDKKKNKKEQHGV